MSPRHPCARIRSGYFALPVVGCGRHGLLSVVGAPRRSYGYAFGAPRPTPSARVPRPGHGAPGTHATAWVEAHQTSAELP
jgi:hypothetical protein